MALGISVLEISLEVPGTESGPPAAKHAFTPTLNDVLGSWVR